jgi:hypothetical protein
VFYTLIPTAVLNGLAPEAHLSGDHVRIVTVPDGEHRLSRPEDIALLLGEVGFW